MTTHLLERVLQREAVDDAREHAHVVRARAVHALARRRDAADDVPASDHDADLDPERVDVTDLLRDRADHGRIDPEAAVAGERLAGQLQQDALERGCHAAGASPSLKRRNPEIDTGPPSFAEAASRSFAIVWSGSFTKGCSVSTISP